MSPVALYFASGESLYPGAAMVLAACVVPRRWSMMRSLFSWFGLILVVMACPPIPWLAYAILGCVFLMWLFTPAAAKRRSIVATAILAGVILMIAGSEFSHRTLPAVTGTLDQQIVIVGDSLSSGLGNVTPWPTFFQRTTGLPVKNLARPGSGVHDAMSMAEQINPSDHMVLLEIGGNDLLADLPTTEFAAGLDSLLRKISAPDRTIVMFELPLIPSRIGYGQTQRRLAAKYHAAMIPKRFLAGVLGPNSTTDGLHLSESGAQRLAAVVTQVLSPVRPLRGENGREK